MTLWSKISACLWLLTGLAILLPSPAGAIEPPEQKCDKTWFPDFRCDRHGRYDGFVMPLSQPYFFEDPFITTGASLVGVWQGTPNSSVMEGGDAWVLALQLRLAITDRLAFIATQDGYTWLRPDRNSTFGQVLDDRGGFNNLTFGFKYAAIDRPKDNLIITPSFRFNVPAGQKDVFQGWGKGMAIPGISYAWGYKRFHFIGDIGAQLPFEWQDQASNVFFNFHFDYALFKHFVPLIEIGGFHYTSNGNGLLPVDTSLGTVPLKTAQAVLGTGGFEAGDVANLGSRGVKGRTLATMAVGAQFPITRNITAGAIYEFPISNSKWLFDERVTMNFTFEF